MVVCRRGNDSQVRTSRLSPTGKHSRCAQLLVQQLLEKGLQGVVDLKGGLAAWAVEVDSSFPTY